jgi:hypothetical protein
MAAPEAAPTPPSGYERRSLAAAALARHRSPLRRRSDTLRTWLRSAFTLGLIAAAALAAVLSLACYQTGRAAAARTAAGLHQVQAQAVTGATVTRDSGTTAQIRYRDLAGVTLQSQVSVAPTVVQGQRLTLWLDSGDQVSIPPASPADSASTAVCVGLLTFFGSSIVIVGARSLAKARLDRNDLRHWEQEWLQVEPSWSHRQTP